MNRKTLISVVIPAYNRADRIGRALDSVREQTYENWEVIVVDDASTDDTAEVVQRHAEVDPRIRLIRHETNRRAQAARNTAIRASKGEWIAFLDSDDWLLPESLALRLEAALRENVSVVHSEYYIITDNAPMQPKGVRPLCGYVYPQLLQCQGPGFPALLVKKTALERIGMLDETIRRFQEWETSIRLARYFNFAFVSEPTFVYDCRGDDTMTKARWTAGGPYEQIVRKHARDILRHVGVAGIATHLFVAGRCYWLGRQWLQSLRCMSLFGFYGLRAPVWLCQTFLQVLRSGGRGSLRFRP